MDQQLLQAQKMETIGRLTAGIAHDFNNLLSVIIFCSDQLLDTVDSSNPTRVELEEIRSAAQRAATLTSQLMAFSRKENTAPQVLDVNSLVTNIEKMLVRLIGRHIKVVLRLCQDPGLIYANPAQIEQIIMNLAVNARDAMPSGGTLTIETATVTNDTTSNSDHGETKHGCYTMLAICDTGIGMTPEVQARIFEPFFTTKERDKGTGLGLSNVYGIIKQNNGYISVHSEPGRGSTFQIYLPTVEAGTLTMRAQ